MKYQAAASISGKVTPSEKAKGVSSMLEGPLLPLLAKLALPTVAVMFMASFLSVAETYFVSSLGTEAIAAASLVVPVMLLMVMVSNGGIGGGVSSSIARAKGAGNQDAAQSLVWHAVVIAVVCGAVFTLTLNLGAASVYRWLGGTGHSLELAIQYSNVLFAGAIAFWVLMLLQAALRGSGNVKVPALIVAASVLVGLAISPPLITGWWGFAGLGVVGAGVAQIASNLVGLLAIVLYMRSPGANLRLQPYRLQWPHFKAILGIGSISSLNAVVNSLTLTLVTSAVGGYGVAAIAGYGIASRLDALLVPVMFGFGTAAITVVGVNIGAGNVARARRAAITNALFVAAILGALGLLFAFKPNAWLHLFSRDPQVIAAGAQYLSIMGLTYAFTAIATELYFAGQAVGRIAWPVAASVFRLGCAGGAVAWATFASPNLNAIYALVALGSVGACMITLWGFRLVPWTPRRV